MKPAIPLLCLALLISSLALTANAQTLSRILAKSGLSPEDFQLMGAAASTLYDVPSPRVGQSEQWKNPDTGSFGTAKLTTFKDGCAYILHKANPKGKDAVTEIRNRFCKSGDGKWVQQP